MTNKKPVVKVIDMVPGEVKDIPGIDCADLDPHVFWEEHVCKHRPLIIRGGARHWKAAQRWSEPGYLESLNDPLQVMLGRTFNAFPAMAIVRNMEQRPISECIAEMRAASDDETLSIPATYVPEEWAKDLGDDFPFLPEGAAKKPRLHPERRMFAYKNASTEWHYHSTDETLTTQLAGTKRLSIFRLTPENWETYHTILDSNMHHIAGGKQFFPQQGAVTKYEAVIGPGDVAYLPAFWWHGIDPADTGVGVTIAYCFRTPWRRLAHWKEPATHKFMPSLRHLHRLPALLILLGISTIVRKIKGEPWYVTI